LDEKRRLLRTLRSPSDNANSIESEEEESDLDGNSSEGEEVRRPNR